MKKYLIIFLLTTLVFSACAERVQEDGEEARAEIKKDYPANLTKKDRIMGAIMGVLIGDALGVGCHWYDDIENLRKDFGWITDYVSPKADGGLSSSAFAGKHRYEAGVRAGDVSQTGEWIIMLLESIAGRGGYDQDDYTTRLDEFFKTINSNRLSGRYTDCAIRDTYINRVEKGLSWDDPNIGSICDTSDAAQRVVILVALLSDPFQVATETYRNIMLTYKNPLVVSEAIVYALTVWAFINEVPLADLRKGSEKRFYRDERIGEFINALIKFDTLHQPGIGAVAWNPAISIEPAYMVSAFEAADCQQNHLLWSAYYLIHRFPDDFEAAILNAINGGGSNMQRAALVGGMSGAMNGLSGIPKRFITGLKDNERLLEMAEKVAELHLK